MRAARRSSYVIDEKLDALVFHATSAFRSRWRAARSTDKRADRKYRDECERKKSVARPDVPIRRFLSTSGRANYRIIVRCGSVSVVRCCDHTTVQKYVQVKSVKRARIYIYRTRIIKRGTVDYYFALTKHIWRFSSSTKIRVCTIFAFLYDMQSMQCKRFFGRCNLCESFPSLLCKM